MHDITDLISVVQAIMAVALTAVLLAVSLSAGTGNMIWLGFARNIRSSEAVLLLVVFGVLSLWLLFNRTKRPDTEPYLSRQTELGEIKVSAQTLNSLVALSLKNLPVIEVHQAVVFPGRKGALAQVSVTVDAAIESMAELAAQIQQCVKDCLGSRLSLQVEQVEVKIVDVLPSGTEFAVQNEAD